MRLFVCEDEERLLSYGTCLVKGNRVAMRVCMLRSADFAKTQEKQVEFGRNLLIKHGMGIF